MLLLLLQNHAKLILNQDLPARIILSVVTPFWKLEVWFKGYIIFHGGHLENFVNFIAASRSVELRVITTQSLHLRIWQPVFAVEHFYVGPIYYFIF